MELTLCDCDYSPANECYIVACGSCTFSVQRVSVRNLAVVYRQNVASKMKFNEICV